MPWQPPGQLFLHRRETGQLGLAHYVISFKLPAELSAQLFRRLLLIVFNNDLQKQTRSHSPSW